MYVMYFNQESIIVKKISCRTTQKSTVINWKVESQSIKQNIYNNHYTIRRQKKKGKGVDKRKKQHQHYYKQYNNYVQKYTLFCMIKEVEYNSTNCWKLNIFNIGQYLLLQNTYMPTIKIIKKKRVDKTRDIRKCP